MLPLRRPAPRCSAVFKSNIANTASAVVDGGVGVGSFAQTSRGRHELPASGSTTDENHESEDAHAIVYGTAFRCRSQGAILKYSGRCSEYDAMRIIFLSVASIFAFRSYVICIV